MPVSGPRLEVDAPDSATVKYKAHHELRVLIMSTVYGEISAWPSTTAGTGSPPMVQQKAS
jgi:hypothetical protein